MVQTSQRASGRISVVQEERFRLITDDGRGLLLTLGNDAGIEPQDLRGYHARGSKVMVEYTGEPNLESGLAVRIWEMD